MCDDCKPWRDDELAKHVLSGVDGPIGMCEYNALVARLHAQAEQERQAISMGILRAARKKKL